MQTLDDLLARVEAATEPDRELDVRIDAASGTGRKITATASEEAIHLWATSVTTRGDDSDEEVTSCPADIFGVPRYTASIDAALALVERMPPGYRWGVSSAGIKTGERTLEGWPRYKDGFKAHVTEPSAIRPMPSVADAPTAPLAIILALLRALRSKGEV